MGADPSRDSLGGSAAALPDTAVVLSDPSTALRNLVLRDLVASALGSPGSSAALRDLVLTGLSASGLDPAGPVVAAAAAAL